MTQGKANDELDELFDESVLQPGMVLEYKDVMWRFNPKWKKDIIAAILSLLERRELEARIASIDEYLTHCDILMQEPSRELLEAFQDGQRHALAELSQLRNPGGGKGSE